MVKKDYYIAAQSQEEFKKIEEAYKSFQERIVLEKTGGYLFLIANANDKKGVIISPWFEDERIVSVEKKGKLESLIIPMEDKNLMVQIKGNRFYVYTKGSMKHKIKSP
jgi:hypothetical protein